MLSPLLRLHDEDVSSVEFLPDTPMLKAQEISQGEKKVDGLLFKKNPLKCVWFFVVVGTGLHFQFGEGVDI